MNKLDCILDIVVTLDNLPNNVFRDHYEQNLHFSLRKIYMYYNRFGFLGMIKIESYFSGVNSDSSATLVVGVFRSNRVGVRDLLVEVFGSN
jgi:hypothetical protein